MERFEDGGCLVFPGSVRAQQEAGEDAVTVGLSSHPFVVFSLQPHLLIPGQVDGQAARRHLESHISSWSNS